MFLLLHLLPVIFLNFLKSKMIIFQMITFLFLLIEDAKEPAGSLKSPNIAIYMQALPQHLEVRQ